MNIKKALIIDGNFLLNKNTFALHKDKLLYGYLQRSLEDSVNAYSNLHYWDKIYFVSDSKSSSWRKNLFHDYKGNREKSEDIDWEFVFTIYEEFKEDLSQKPNVVLLEEDSIEGDDWISYVVNEKNKEGYSFLIIASDHDLKQLINFNLNPLTINMMSNEFLNREKVYIPKNYEVFMTELNKNRSMDLFELNDNGAFHDFIKMFLEKRTVNESDPIQSLITKMISGDKSDNIDSVFRKQTKTGKWQGIGDAGAKKIYDMYINEFGVPDVNDEDLFENIADLVCESKKASYSNMESIQNNLAFNRQLVDLNNLPDFVIEKMKNKLDSIEEPVDELKTDDDWGF